WTPLRMGNDGLTAEKQDTGTNGQGVWRMTPMTVIDTPGIVRDTVGWTHACRLDYLIPGRGVAVLLRGGRQAALFLTGDGMLYAVGNIDPIGRAAVLSRGIVGD